MMVLQRKYCRDIDAGIYKNIYQYLVVLDPYKEIFISKVCLEVIDTIKMYVIIKAVSIHLKINIIMKSKNVWQKLLVGNKGLKLKCTLNYKSMHFDSTTIMAMHNLAIHFMGENCNYNNISPNSYTYIHQA